MVMLPSRRHPAISGEHPPTADLLRAANMPSHP
jgi:hypothetical protein